MTVEHELQVASWKKSRKCEPTIRGLTGRIWRKKVVNTVRKVVQRGNQKETAITIVAERTDDENPSLPDMSPRGLIITGLIVRILESQGFKRKKDFDLEVDGTDSMVYSLIRIKRLRPVSATFTLPRY